MNAPDHRSEDESEREGARDDENEKIDVNETEVNVNAQVRVSDDHTMSRSGEQPTRRSTRVTYKPYRLDPNDYAQLALEEPLTYIDAIKDSNSEKWLQAMMEEVNSLIKNKTWTVVDRTNDMNVVGSKWVFKIKRGVEGKIARYKARLVAKGYTQVYGIDYRETFAPVLKYKSLRIILALSTSTHINIEQMDVKTAFLNATVSEDIYVEVPEGMRLMIGEGKVLKLQRALYGIKQAPREWNENIDAYLRSLGYQPCKKDPCLYIKMSKTNKHIIIGLFVDDIVSAYDRENEDEWNEIKDRLKERYELTDMGAIQHVLGMRVKKRDDGTITIDQQLYIEKKLSEFGMSQCASL